MISNHNSSSDMFVHIGNPQGILLLGVSVQILNLIHLKKP